MKGNEALDALVALCDVERVDRNDGGSEENGTKVVRQALSSSQATGTVTDRHSASSNSHLNSTLLAHNFPGLSSSQTSTLGHSLPLNYAPYIQFLQSQMMNAQHLNPIQSASMAPIMDNIGLPLFLPKVNDITSHGSNSYQSSLNPLQPVQHLSDMANGSVYSQLIKSLNASTSSSQQQVSYLSKNAAYSSVPQHELSSHKHKTTMSENISLTPSVASAEDNKKGAKQLVLDSTDNKTAGLSDQDDDDSDGLSSSHYGLNKEDKKSNKRAANRLSAQLSRRRRKMFMEELKEENEKLKRKESILNSIPDLVIVFDSAGKISFISKSACTILKFQVEELQESSFWGLLCEESERLLKAAFMDSLAAKEEDTESVPLGQGMWEIRMVDKDKSQKVVALHGVVHFTGENPQCVCTIRPREQYTTMSSSLPLSQNVPTDMRNSHSNIFSTKISTSSSSSKISSVESVTSRGVVSESTTDGF